MIKNQIKTVLLLGILTGLLLGVGQLIGGSGGLLIGFILAIIMNFFSYWFSDKIVLMMYRAQPIPEKDNKELFNLVKEVAKSAELPMPKLYLIPTSNPNAFATGRNPKHAAVAVTEGILRLLSKEELKGVIAHEMAHVKNRDILISTVAATIAGVISYLAYMARFASIFGGGRDRDSGNMFQLLALTIITPLIAMIIQLAISRSREYLADETGAKTIKDPKALANALEKLEQGVKHNPMQFGNPSTSSLFILNPFSAKGMMALLSTHPSTEERVKRLRSM
jgi:heat shock protein HtpX